jgi:hypothetical protein
MRIDKLYAFIIGKRKLKIKEAILMVCAARDSVNTLTAMPFRYAPSHGSLRHIWAAP